ncbi:sn-glycerol-3-phosphate ABC transporter ATP-binding protein UgpC [Paracoccus subflavus]|uniref:sn-glycerol-3-phosphate ABC transporter ATP-binding protein UgpC n=1 Tax=Paracoccus subflavus TaxID=2528244 RepID=A0A4Q9G588_9RHOB|nr:sn-glycerol-3-phosphate ABC transporter ATP-binding protein UgpC [Paracoccus subflavus]TBN40004.1 sn-glycerol-3-phosphate ABC transporter ATP-binding protein UgpC [Paracoccus subflavus]
MPEVEFDRVEKTFGGTRVLHGVSLDIAQGAFAVILGPSGCGKSTLLRMLAGLERVSAGEVRLNGRRMNDVAAKDRDLAMVFQNYALYPHMTVAENLGYALKVARVPRTERAARVAEVAATLQLSEMLDRRPGQLSGGQRQRVAMGRAIIRRPRVFLFDEPLSNLDAKLRTQMRIEIKRLHLKQGVTSLFVTHDQVEAMTLADRLVVMNAGRIEQAGTPSEVYHRPASAFVAGFLGTPPMNLIPAEPTADGRAVEVEALGRFVVEGPALPGRAPLIAGLRPEHASRGPGVSLPVEMVEELGNGRLVHLRCGDRLVAVMLPEGDRAPVADRLSIAFDPDRLMLFAADGSALPQRLRAIAVRTHA